MFDFHNLKNLVYLGVLLWALAFGVNFNGKHYGLRFRQDGVSLVYGEPVGHK